ncbi:S-layer homology domain-containing protein [uncultured Jatrophihabitans sp.]|uniref:S-layer homology domain-containing protein n=1 Tax=uncultured Jatrophihabitans sp. TaxID=1610747 RepID=UPI0035CAED9A
MNTVDVHRRRRLISFFAVLALGAATVSVAPSAVAAAAAGPTFNGANPAALLTHKYSYQQVASTGSAATSYRVFAYQTPYDLSTNLTYGKGAFLTGARRVHGALYIPLRAVTHPAPPGLPPVPSFGKIPFYYFNASNGRIQLLRFVSGRPALAPALRYADYGALDAVPQPYAETNFVIVANNGHGGAKRAHAGVVGGGKTRPTPPVKVHDVDSPVVAPRSVYTDVPMSNPLAPAVYSNSAPAGYPDGSYRPAAALTRSELVATSPYYYEGTEGDDGSRLTGPCGGTVGPFRDVPPTWSTCHEIANAARAGIMTGFPDGSFRPEAPVERQALAAFIYRGETRTNPSVTPTDAPCTSHPFRDVRTDNPFCGDIAALAKRHVFAGYPDGTFRPGRTISRLAAAAVLSRR